MNNIRKRSIIIITAALILIALNSWISLRRLPNDLELKSYGVQSMYHPTFLSEGQYPDLFLRLLVRGRRVYVSSAIKTYDQYETFGHDEDDGNPFDRNYLVDNDYTHWFKLYAAEVEVDASLLKGETVSKEMGKHRADFTLLGRANDMLRYSFAMNREKVQQASAFWYSWYYHSYAERVEKGKNKRDLYPDIYVAMEGLSEGEALVAVWGPEQDLYLMGENYYREIMA